MKDQNLITNGNFEKGTDGWDAVAFGKKGKTAIDPMELYEGKPTLRIENAEGDHTFVKFTIQGKPHTSYRLSWMVKTKDVQSVKEGGRTGAVLMIGQTNNSTAPVQRTTPWKRVSVDFSTGDKAEIRAGPSLGTYASPVTGTAWFADISLLELGDAAVAAPPKISATTPRPLTTSPSVAADIVKNNRSNLVFVTTPDGAGSGFIAKFGAGTFLVTNAHVAAGAKGAMFKTLDGTQVQGGDSRGRCGARRLHDGAQAGRNPVRDHERRGSKRLDWRRSRGPGQCRGSRRHQYHPRSDRRARPESRGSRCPISAGQ